MAKKKMILKIGSSTLTASTDRISYAKIEDIARQIISLKKEYEIVIVSSGAIATARQFVDIGNSDLKVTSKQALAAIGQPKLMTIYDEVFSSFGLKVAQCLLVYRDFQNDIARDNIRNTIDKLLEFGYNPIINENDTVSADEIVLGDNDKLSALVASVVGADLLILASDIDGLFDSNPNIKQNASLISEVINLKDVKGYIQEMPSEHGTGGMTTKLQAAQICQDNKIEMWIVNGGKPGFILNALNDSIVFTKFLNS